MAPEPGIVFYRSLLLVKIKYMQSIWRPTGPTSSQTWKGRNTMPGSVSHGGKLAKSWLSILRLLSTSYMEDVATSGLMPTSRQQSSIKTQPCLLMGMLSMKSSEGVNSSRLSCSSQERLLPFDSSMKAGSTEHLLPGLLNHPLHRDQQPHREAKDLSPVFPGLAIVLH